MKRFIGLMLVLSILMGMNISVIAASNNTDVALMVDQTGTGAYVDAKVTKVQVVLDGVVLNSDVPAFALGSRTLVPLRLIGEALGAKVQWFSQRSEILITKPDLTLRMKTGATTALVNGSTVTLPDGVPAVLAMYNGIERTMVPLRFISELLGASVSWDQNTKSANISSKDSSVKIIVIDPGHGGGDGGAYYGGIAEKDINLAVSQKLAALLEAEGYRVIMTRTSDKYIGLVSRAALANDAEADLFISIHANATEVSKDYAGIFTYYYPKSRGGKTLAQNIQSEICRYTNAIDRGILTEEYVVLKRTKMSAVLIELGFMTNPTELQNLNDSAYQYKLAKGIVAGVNNYFN